MSDETTHLKLPYILASQAQKHVTHNEAIRLLDALVQMSAISRSESDPPASPNDGDRYIVASGGTGAWAGWDLNVAYWVDGAWMKLVPQLGWRAWVVDEARLVIWTGAAWEPVEGIPESGAVIQNAALIGLGTAADAQNPFSAKINKALWTARYASEGGDGDLFYTMNKEAAGGDVGFLLQTDFVTKALLGLFGSNNLRLAVSADGSAFNDAFEVDHETGVVSQPRLPRFKGYTNFDNYVAVDTWTKIAINNTEYNDQNAFDAGNNRFVAPAAGTYLFGASLLFKVNSSTRAHARPARAERHDRDPGIVRRDFRRTRFRSYRAVAACHGASRPWRHRRTARLFPRPGRLFRRRPHGLLGLQGRIGARPRDIAHKTRGRKQ
jgi:hypothetical protein